MSNWVHDAAELLGINPRVMNYKIKTLAIEYPRAAVTHGRRGVLSGYAFGCAFHRCRSLRGVDVRVALRGAQPRVAEQLLDGAQVGAGFQQMRRE
jgi:hypothetical protein